MRRARVTKHEFVQSNECEQTRTDDWARALGCAAGSAPFVGIRAGCDKQCPPCYRDVSARCAH